MAEILLWLDHMHSFYIINRDLKLETVNLDADGRYKSIDFGLSILTTNPIKGYAGTPGYTAPEVCSDGYYTIAADFFRFCVSVYRMMSGKAFR